MPLNVVAGVEITPQRRSTDFGETEWADLTQIERAVVILDKPSVDLTVSGNRYSQGETLFVPRGSDLKDGDRFPYQGKMYGVVGDARWDMDHPFTGYDFGYVEYTIRLGG